MVVFNAYLSLFSHIHGVKMTANLFFQIFLCLRINLTTGKSLCCTARLQISAGEMKGNEVKWGKQVANRRAVVPEGAWHTWVARAESGPVQYLVWLSVHLWGPGLEGTIVWLVLGWCAVPWWPGPAVTSKQGHGKVCSELEAGEQGCSCEFPVCWYS